MRRGGFIGDQEENNAPMIEIFGGVFALLLVLFLLMNMFSQAGLQERLEQSAEEGLYKIGWGPSGAGFVVLSYPDHLRLIETGETIERGKLCARGSAYIPYARRIYGGRGANQQLIFAILEGGVATMAEARNCLRALLPGRRLSIGWIIADNELLKSVSIGDIPPHIQETIAP